jgi:hypothetical protein
MKSESIDVEIFLRENQKPSDSNLQILQRSLSLSKM